ncbi:unnamed protein product, partial [Ostreobium quekettii]
GGAYEMSVFDGVFGPGGAQPHSSLFGADSQFRSEGQAACAPGAAAREEAAPHRAESTRSRVKRKKAGAGAGEHAAPEAHGEAARDSGGGSRDAMGAEGPAGPDAKRARKRAERMATPAEWFSSGEDEEGEAGGERPRPRRKKRKLDSKDAAELKTTIFVGNLPATVEKRQLEQIFQRYGAIESVRIRSIPVREGTKMPKRAAAHKGEVNKGGTCNAYVVFAKKKSAKQAQGMNMTMFEGRHLRVDRAAQRAGMIAEGSTIVADSIYDSRKSVFVGNLDYSVEDEDLIRLFDDGGAAPLCAGMVEAVRVVRDVRTRQGKGIAFVKFRTREAVAAAMRLDGHKFKNREIRIKAVDKPKSKKGSAKGQLPSGGEHSLSWQGVRTKGPGKSVRSTPGMHKERRATKKGPRREPASGGKHSSGGVGEIREVVQAEAGPGEACGVAGAGGVGEEGVAAVEAAAFRVVWRCGFDA